jgi:hypothetical protein
MSEGTSSPSAAPPAGEAPKDPSDLDEFAGLAPAPPGKSPVLALCIIGIAAVTLFQLRGDIRYALSPRTAVPIEELRGAGVDSANRHVRVRGVPERRTALYIEPRGEKARETFFRLIDADPPVFVRALDTSGRADLNASWSGRLRRFGDTPYAASLKEYFAKGSEVARYLEPQSVRARLESRSGGARDRLGRAVELREDTRLLFLGGMERYAIYMSREKYPKADDAERELRRILADAPGGPAAALTHAEDTPDAFVFTLPLAQAGLMPRDVAARLEREDIDFAGWPDRIEATVGQLQISGAGDQAQLSLRGKDGPVLPWREVTSVSFREPLRVADDAMVLTEGESPAGLLWAPLVGALLLGLAAWNVWYLLRPRRRA